ncbi:hypothetical protein DVH24_023427 [Malus domestica]|uniref:Nucleotide-diphospho-sugar transferase domain-containing protein n=1 Tax=Malus domestica TaxID=3750 RepID=A0A498I7T3_MALDO|nr:hypothetical protein DVH24_023427 [Malus domestica]
MKWMLKHLVVICLDEKAYARQVSHPHYYRLNTQGANFTREAATACHYDIQFSCDYFIGDPYTINIFPNTGLFYVKSNDRTVLFYKFWSPEIRIQKNRKQDVLNEINLISLLLRLY